MPSLRLRLIALFVLLSLVVAAVMIAAVQRFSSEQITDLAMASGLSAAEAQAMFDQYVGRGGSYFFERNTNRLPNRQTPTATLRDLNLGLRVCAPFPTPR